MKSRLAIQGRAILLVEDDAELATEIQAELERCGHLVTVERCLPSDEEIRSSQWSLLILDRLLFSSDALSSLEVWRCRGIRIPILVVSVLSSAEEIAAGLNSGADDYLAKPFALAELAARVDALLRRLGHVATTRVLFDDIEIDLIEQKAFRKGQMIDLLPRELRLLEYFLRRPDQVITRMMLLKDVWQYKFPTESNVVDAHISNLRKKIDDRQKPSLIANIRGVGFMLRKRS